VEPLEAPADRRQLGLGRRDPHSRPQAADRHADARRAVLPLLGGQRQRQPGVGLGGEAVERRHVGAAREGEARRHHAGHDHGVAVEDRLPAHHPRVGAEPAPPAGVGEQHRRGLARGVVGGHQPPAQRGRGAQQRGEVAGDADDVELARIAAAGQRHGGGLHHGEPLQRAALAPPVVEIAVGDRQLVGQAGRLRQRRVRGPRHHQPAGVAERRRLEQRRVDDAEDRGVAADAERQGEHGGKGEAGLPGEAAGGEAEVLDHVSHRALMWLSLSPIYAAPPGGLRAVVASPLSAGDFFGRLARCQGEPLS